MIARPASLIIGEVIRKAVSVLKLIPDFTIDVVIGIVEQEQNGLIAPMTTPTIAPLIPLCLSIHLAISKSDEKPLAKLNK